MVTRDSENELLEHKLPLGIYNLELITCSEEENELSAILVFFLYFIKSFLSCFT